MPVKPHGSAVSRVARFAGVAACLLVVGAALDAALAQASPFGAARQPVAGGGLTGWLLAQQSVFYRALSGMIVAAKADGSAVFSLYGLSFAYGVFHAAGPGHGKAVISSYLVANEETWRRGVVLSFASALLQALVAIAIVGIAAVVLGATAKMMGDTVRVIETASYFLIVLVGARLLWVKGLAFLTAWHARGREPEAEPVLAPMGADVTPVHYHEHHGRGHGYDQRVDHHAHHHHHDAEDRRHHDEHCGHSHGPEPADLAGPGGWRRGLSAIFAVGLRPCSGAIIVLVFALAQGLFWAGVGATVIMGLGTAITVAIIASLAVGARSLAVRLAAARSGAGTLAMRGIEVAAAVLVIAFGVLLLTGYMASERMFAV